ncbi:lactonase family protein [Streptomyces sp. WMMB 322]|uniref:lactonase family protein n=1 Tax=Streptomyces sp. WMMB 322 TaxID=1286821 RepID=UPI0008238865|nr:lactonase family protein [Streptomyces sp. WMMB 322]SCK57350.1 6-phosphogluconolactonase, cycloisomerase 2 family [Streptomyces sp. WMMB 322]
MSEVSGQWADRAYIGSFTSAGGRGITTAALDPESGALTELHHTETLVPDPSYLTVVEGPGGPGSAGGHLYAVSERETGGAAAFSLADRDRPELLGEPTPVGGAGPTHLTVAAGHLITANYGSGSISALPVRADGTLGSRASVHQHTGHGPETQRQEGPHAHAVVPDPSGRWLLSVDLGTDSVWIYDLRDACPEGEPLPYAEAHMRPGSGPRHLVFHPDGAHAYIVNELASSVTVCAWDAGRGALEATGETATVPDSAAPERNFPSELAVSPDGRFAWAANRGHDSISVFAVAAAGDSLQLTGTVPCGGHWPRDLALHPSGRHLYAANERSGDVTWFAVDQVTGTPHREGTVSVPAAGCVVFG